MQAAVDATVLAFGGLDLVVNNAGLSLSKALLDTTVADWDLQHNVMAKGSFLVSQAAAKVLIEQRLGGDIVYISSKNSIFAGPNNIAYSATKADQAHQVRLLAAELGEHGVKVNGINPDGVVRGSGIFAGGWGAKRAAVYGVARGGPGQVLRPAHPAQARGAARARGQRRLRALLGATCRTPPACTSRSTPASPRPSCGDDDRPDRRRASRPPGRTVGAIDIGASSGRVVAGSVGRRRRRPRGGAPVPQRRADASTATCAGTSTGLYEQVLVGLHGAGRALSRTCVSIGIDTWAVDYGLLDADGRLLARADRLPGRPDRGGDRRRARTGRSGASCTRSAACSSCRSTRSTSSPPSSAAPQWARGRGTPCCCPTCWPTG